ncbi:MAG TPA: c-type cytochrome [Byssovorax sp.]
MTRVPWQKEQQGFFDMELKESKDALSRSQQQWEQEIAPALKDKLARQEELEKSQATGEYAQAKKRLAELNQKFSDAELGKTFGQSDLDEAYYYREQAEYARDRASTVVRQRYRDAWAGDAPSKAEAAVDLIYSDPPQPPQTEAETDKIYHLDSEIARMTGHIAQIDHAITSAPDEAKRALVRSRAAEQEVIDRLRVEVKHQHRVDAALTAMANVDGPADPPLDERDPQKRAEERKRERERVCQGKEDTRNCIIWLKLEPVDAELKSIEVDIAKRRRVLTDAELRESKAVSRAKPKFDVANVIHSLVGPYQIQQTVLHWIDQDRDVDTEQVDRCQTCHMGEDNASYTSASISPQFRTHPFRSTLIASHPIEKFGCTSCHQGQGRATDMLSHSGWHLEEKHGKERWHFAGDHYWDDPLLPVGALTRTIVDSSNDEVQVKIARGKWETIKIPHRSQIDHDRTADMDEPVEPEYKEEAELFGAMQEKLAPLVDADLQKRWHAVVRKLDNRVQFGLEANDASQHIAAKDVPTFGLKFAKPGLATMLGFPADVEIMGKGIVTAPAPPSAPVRSDGMAFIDDTGRYHPPRGDEGLQVPDGMRNRFIESLPEVEAGCTKCHVSDVDLRPRASGAKFVSAKLDYEKAEAARERDPVAFKKAHDGSDDLPAVLPDPATVLNPAPTLAEGRALFRKLNCTGCHILDGFAWDRNSGPSLDNVTAKVSPEYILTWIRNPRGWREKTRMPNLWPKPLDVASKRPFAPGSPDYAKWEAQMREETVAVASFLVDRSDNPASRPGASKDAKPLKAQIAGYASVPNATAERGKKIFESYGCQGCHARSDHDEANEKLPEAWRNRERDVAPTLANMGGKTTADWVAYWVEEPNRYWHGTKMPNLRLDREEAASVGLYVASLKSPPLNAASVDKADVAIVSDPARRAERVPCASANGQKLSRVECGEKLIGYYGCFGCHQISGFEKNAPVAPELGGFAKKDVTTLDFGYALADHHLQTTETFATLKLDSPRIYRRDRIELKMADFDLSPREIRALVTFLKSLVSSKPKEAYQPDKHPDYAAALEGRQIIDDYNCRGCHVIEGRGADIDGFRANQLGADPQARAPFLNGEGMRVQPEWLFTFLREPGKHGIRPWLHPEWIHGEGKVPADNLALRMPTFNLTPDQVTAIVRYFASWDGEEYPYQAASVPEQSQDEKLYALTHMNSGEAANCLSCHYQSESDSPTVADLFDPAHGRTDIGKLAPNFNHVRHRLRPEWVKAWLLKPSNFLPYTKMTAFWATKDRDKKEELWPAEGDPFLSGPLAWNKAPAPKNVDVERQVELVRDFLYALPGNVKFPVQGQEATSPLVTGKAAETAAAEPAPADDAEPEKDDKKGKDKGKGKDAKKKKRKTGRADLPVHM